MGGLQITSGHFAANGAWLVLAAIAFNLTRAAGTIASVFHAKATTATIRRQLIAVPGRLARSARRLVIHLPKDWPWHDGWEGLRASPEHCCRDVGHLTFSHPRRGARLPSWSSRLR